MNPFGSDWPAVSALFDKVLELPKPLRQTWLEALPEPERIHRPTLERLLAAHARAETADFLNTLPKVGAAPEAGADEAIGGRTIGPYRLLHEIGRGGMGSVWLAERQDGLLKRPVALKLPHPGLATRAFADRLARERDILASLTHPHIARLYDAGISADGQPFLALAYIEGQAITEHVRSAHLDLRERVGLFQQVLDAVQHAHSLLVIHRDLKPSNVMVDLQGQVQLLDFGIAKLLVDGQADATELTLEGAPALTPDFASPEQIAGLPISTVSDVYSLGVLLFELLAGERPYRLQRGDRHAMAQAVADIDIPRPSTLATSSAQARQLRGDLDTIVLKALKKHPAERYAGADAFRQDLQRWLDGAPVLAQPDSLAYRSGKFLRRHRLVSGVGALLVLSLGIGLAGTTWQARQARLQAHRAEAVKDFLKAMFDEAEPVNAQGRVLTARELLDRGQRDLQSGLASQPALTAELDGVLADLYAKLGDETRALPLAEARLKLALELDGPQSLAYGDALYSLGDIQGGQRQHAKSLQTFMQAREVLRRHASEREDLLLKLEGHLAYQLTELERFREASATLEALLPQLAAHFGPTRWEFIQNKALLSHALAAQGEKARAATLNAEIEPLLDSVDKRHELDAAVIRNNIGLSQLNSGHPDDAVRLLHGALQAFQKVLGPDASPSLNIQRTLGAAQYEQGRFEDASVLLRENIERAARVMGAASPGTQLSETYAVKPLIQAGHVAEAEAMARRAVQPGPGRTTLGGDIQNRLGLALLFDGQAAEALRVLQAVAAEVQQAGKSNSDTHGRSLLYQAGAQAMLGNLAAAVQASEQAARIFAGSAVAADGQVARAQLTQALALARSGQGASAQALIEQAAEHLRRDGKPGHPVHLMLKLAQAAVLQAEGHVAEGERLDAEAREQLKPFGALPPKPVPLVF